MKSEIIGWGHSKFGKLQGVTLEDLVAQVSSEAIINAGIDASDVSGIFVGAMNNGFSRQTFEGSLVGLCNPELAHVPAVHLENACASGSAALYAALDFLDAGRGDIALVVGAEKMSATPVAEVGDILLGASYRKEEAGVEGGFAGVFANIAKTYSDRYGDCLEAMAMIAAKNHANGVENPLAHFQKDLGFEFCNIVSDKNPNVAGILRRTDCSLISDGAAAIVVARPEIAAKMRKSIRFLARQQVNDHLPLSRRDPIEFLGAEKAWKQAKEEAGLSLEDLSLVETHDCFTIAELIEYEAMGLTKRGQGATAIREGWTQKDGKLPINPSGGLKSKGHPVGATGVSQHVMACLQLMNEAKGMQIKGANIAGVFNMGGAAVANYVSILERVK